MSFKEQINVLIEKAYAHLGFEPPKEGVQISNRPDLADYQFNGALSVKTGVGPRAVAEKIKDYVDPLCPFATVSISSPGFLNFRLREHALISALNSAISLQPPHPDAPAQTIILDYGGPNVAKPMHVGHLRSAIIGETLKRLCRFMGHKVIADVHLGDWGTQIGMVLLGLQEQHPQWPYFKEPASAPYPDIPDLSFPQLQELYPLMSARCKQDPQLAERARLITCLLQNGHPGYRALWKHIVDLSVHDIKTHFSKLSVDFDQWFGESRYQDQVPALLKELEDKGLTQVDQGALILPLGLSAKKEMPPILLKKSDGGYLYATTDLATLWERIHKFKAQRVIYVVDARQKLHFDQVFTAAAMAGHKVCTDFIGFGTMNGPDNKPFKTRQGGAMRLEELIDLVIDEAEAKLEATGFCSELDPLQKRQIAEKVGIAALKFADLQHNPLQSYQFDLNKFMSFEGKTGPYLLYAVVRLKSILEKAPPPPLHLSAEQPLSAPERGLALTLLNGADHVKWAYERMSPHILCDYAFEVAQKFSRFYQNCPILAEENSEVKGRRILLCVQTLRVLEDLLEILGFSAPDRM